MTLGEHVLVLSADGAEPALGAIAAALEAAKIPYALWVAREHPGALTGEALSKGRNGLWRGVVLATGNLGWFDGTRWTSALSEAEWRNLWGYEAAFGVRQVTWFTYPTGDYGFLVAAPHDPADGALVARPTRAGATLFPELAGQLRVEGAWAYLAQPLATRVTP